MHFPCFLLGPDSSSSARQMEKGSQSTPCAPGRAPAAGLAATGANWGSFRLVRRERRDPRHPQPVREHPGMLGVWGTRPVGAVVWQRLALARQLRRVRCQAGFLREQIPARVGGKGRGSGCCRGGVPCAWERCSRWDLWGAAGMGGDPAAWGGVPRPWWARASPTALPPGCTGVQPGGYGPGRSPRAPQSSRGGFGGGAQLGMTACPSAPPG